MAPRIGLTRARKAAAYTQEGLAEALHVAPATVSNWERGKTEPVPYKRPKLAKLLGVTGERLEELLQEGLADDAQVALASPRRRVLTRQLDVAPKFPNVDPQYHSSLDRTLVHLATVADVGEPDAARASVDVFTEDFSARAVLAWLVGDVSNDVEPSGKAVTCQDIDELVTTTKTLDQLDRRFGGDYSRDLAIKYLTSRVLPLLRGTSAGSLRREAFQAAAVLCEVIGYMAYDSQLHVLARHYFVQALRLAKEADSSTYGSFVLATMSHQALYVGQPDQALMLAQASQHQSAKTLVPAVVTEAVMLEAVAHAALGNRRDSTRALERAEVSFHRHNGSDDIPYWMSHWDDAVFASFAGSVWLDLGETSAAKPYLAALWGSGDQQVRRQVFAAGQLAKTALLEREVERAVHYGTIAVDAAASAKSKRSHRIVRDLLAQLAEHRQVASVRDLTGRAAALLPTEEP